MPGHIPHSGTVHVCNAVRLLLVQHKTTESDLGLQMSIESHPVYSCSSFLILPLSPHPSSLTPVSLKSTAMSYQLSTATSLAVNLPSPLR